MGSLAVNSERMEARCFFCFALFLLLSICHAQCPLNVSDSELFAAITQAGKIRESDFSKFVLQDLTHLCYVRSTTNNATFSQLRVSMLYTYNEVRDKSAQATFSVCISMFRFSKADISSVTEDAHFTANMTREGCQDCLDNSTFARPTFCRRK